MLLPEEEQALLRAAPSFAPQWAEWEETLREGAQLPLVHAIFDGDQRSRMLLNDLADHLGESVAVGRLDEAQAVFAELERIYERAGSAAELQLTIGFLESLIYATETADGEASALSLLAMGPRTAAGWQAAVAHLQRRFM